MSNIKDIYGLELYNSDFQSSLTDWYNELIFKSENELNVSDVSRMIRQNLLKDVAIDKAIELFCVDPYDGEMFEGDLIALLVSCGSSLNRSSKVALLQATILKVEKECSKYDWLDEESKSNFEQNLNDLKVLVIK